MTSTQPTAQSDPPDAADMPLHPSDLLLQLIVAFLAPMFLSASTGDVSFARLAAMETLASYGARSQAELMNIAQIIAFGLAAMDSLWLSMADDVSLTMKIRLRSTANGLNRSAQQNQRVLDQRRLDTPPLDLGVRDPRPMTEQPAALFAADEITETEVQASIENAHAMLTAARARMAAQRADQPLAAEPAPAQPPAAETQPARPDDSGHDQTRPALTTQAAGEQQRKLMWASAMSRGRRRDQRQPCQRRTARAGLISYGPAALGQQRQQPRHRRRQRSACAAGRSSPGAKKPPNSA